MQFFQAISSKFRIGRAFLSKALFLLWFLLLFLIAPVWAQSEARVAVPLADVHRNPNAGSERVTQVFLWDRILIVKPGPVWSQVIVPEQYRTSRGYPGFIETHLLAPVDFKKLGLHVTVTRAQAKLRPEGSGAPETVYLGTRLKVAKKLPDGDFLVAWPGESDLYRVAATDVDAEQPTADGQVILDTARQLSGTPYLWGGMSGRGIDCSGLVYTAYRRHGYTLPRDADQQAMVGSPVPRSQLKIGDLVFFGATANDITHIGLYLKDGLFLHASKGRGVSVGSLAGDYYSQRFQGGRRILRGGLSEPLVETPGDGR